MNHGELRERIELLELNQINDVFCWQPVKKIWAKTEFTGKTNLFSKVGIGVTSVQFLIRKQPLNLHQAFRWNGIHCFLTEIKPEGLLYLQVTAARIEPKKCSFYYYKKKLNTLNRPEKDLCVRIHFPGCVTEKYLGYHQKDSHSENKTTFVLVTPKEICLDAGKLVLVEKESYHIKICHLLDEYKNEYEITRTKDV